MLQIELISTPRHNKATDFYAPAVVSLQRFGLGVNEPKNNPVLLVSCGTRTTAVIPGIPHCERGGRGADPKMGGSASCSRPCPSPGLCAVPGGGCWLRPCGSPAVSQIRGICGLLMFPCQVRPAPVADCFCLALPPVER